MTPTGPSILALLQQDHDALLGEAKAMSQAPDPAAARRHYRQLRSLLAAHARAEEAVVYRALGRLALPSPRETAQEGRVEHALCDLLIHNLAHGSAATVLWQARAKVLYELLVHHLLEEHDTMLPMLSRHFDAPQLVRLGQRFVHRKQALLNSADEVATRTLPASQEDP